MPVKFNTEFNYRYQIQGNTPWEKIKHLQGFLEGRERAAALEQVSDLKHTAFLKEIEHLINSNAPEHVILLKKAEFIEHESFRKTEKQAFELNKQEIKIIKKIMEELYEIVEPTRAIHEDGSYYSDEEMFELNAANEFTAMIGKEIYAEIAANGRPSAAKIGNAMSNPYTLQALKKIGLIPDEIQFIEANPDPKKIELNQVIQKEVIEFKTLNLIQNTIDRS